MQGRQWLEEIGQDARYGWRSFSRAPSVALVLVVTLALAIGANTAIFSIVYAVLLRPLPYKEASRLVAVWDRQIAVSGDSKLPNVYRDLQVYRTGAHSFEDLAGAIWAVDPEVMSGHGSARDVFAVPVTANFFDLLGAQATLGRTFEPEDVNRGCAVVLSNQFWRSTFGSERALIGTSIHIGDQSCDVVGVMPADFAFIPEETDLWKLVTVTSAMAREPNRHGIGIFGRLKPGVTLPSALSELKVLHKLAHVEDRHASGSEPQVLPLAREFRSLSGTDLRFNLLVLFAAVIAVLMIACVNVANLLFGRSLKRQKELAIRAALGSRRARLLRQLLTENLLLSLCAAVLGSFLAMAVVRYFRALDPVTLPPGAPVAVNLPVLAFTAALSVLTTVVFGFVPAWRASQTDLNDVLKASGGRGYSSSRSGQRVSRGLVILEVMLSLVLLISAGLLIRSTIEFAAAPLGFATERIVAMSLTLPPASYATPVERLAFYRRVTDKLEELPEIQGSTLTSAIPSIGGSASGVLSVEGRAEAANAPNDTREQFVSSKYFHFFRIPLLRGREFVAGDRLASQAVTVVNEALVRRYFPNEDPIGKHLRFRGALKTEWLQVVGVVRNEKHYNTVREMSWITSPLIYRPLAQDPPAQIHVLVHAARDAGATGSVVQRQLAELDPAVPVFGVQTLEHFLSQFTLYPQFRAALLGGFAGLALLLAVVGLYSVLSQLVEQRTQEIGVRVALGAQRNDVLRLVLRRGMLLTGIGLSLGLFSAWAVTRFLASLLYGVESTDPVTFAAVSLVILAAAFAAMYVPARRAAKLDPIKALRNE